MERYTKYINGMVVIPVGVSGQEVSERLAEYEDIGLTPQEVAEMKAKLEGCDAGT